MNRKPYVAGYFYPAAKAELRKTIEKYIDKNAPKEEAIGVLVPHAGYQYSGPVTGATLSRIHIKDTFIIIGPSHSGMGKPFSVMTEGTWETPLGEVAVDSELAGRIVEISDYLREDVQAHLQEHAVEVQVPFLQYFKPDVKIVPIILSSAPSAVYREIGRDIAKAIMETGREAVVMASGDMTHYEPHETARAKDLQAVEAMLALDEAELTRRYKDLRISMCAYGPVVCLLEAAKKMGASHAELVRYQTSGDTTGDYAGVVGYAGVIFTAVTMHPLAALAKKTVETYVKEGRQPPPPDVLTAEMQEQAGVFVSIHKLDALRGCIGTFEPQQPNVAMETIVNAVSAATQDPRFSPVKPAELSQLDYSVDVLTTPRPVEDTGQLDPKKYGVIVEAGWRRGLLLPDLEGVDSAEQQISICRQKAGIGTKEPVKLYRFEVRRYK